MSANLKHFTTPEFWECYRQLPEEIRELADKNYELLKADSKHPSLRFKQIGNLWSVVFKMSHRSVREIKYYKIDIFRIGSWLNHIESLRLKRELQQLLAGIQLSLT